MNVMASLSTCEIQDHVYSERREEQTEKERKQGQSGSAGAGLRGHTAGFNKKAGKGAFWVLHASPKLGVRCCFCYEGFWQS